MMEAAREFEHNPRSSLGIDDLRELITGRDRGDRRAEYCIIALEKMGVIEAAPEPEHFRFVRSLAPEEIAIEEIEAKKERDLRRLLDLLKLVQSGDVRRYVLDYFELD